MTHLKSMLAATMLLAAAAQIGTAGAADHDTAGPDQGNSDRQTTSTDRATATSPFRAPQFISAITEAPLALLDGGDRKSSEQRLFYVLSFSLAMDRSCDFLTGYAVRQLGFTLSPVTTEALRQGLTERTGPLLRFAAAGQEDAKVFYAKFGCTAEPARKALRSLSAMWESV